MSAPALHPALLPLIEAIARQAAQDYLTAQAASNKAEFAPRTNHVPLHPVHKAA